MVLVVLVCALAACACALQAPARARPHRDVTTSAGVARGYLYPRPPHFAFLGLPYARPPSRQGRFKRAETAARWDGVLEATYRVRCAQPGARRDAACQVLNVFVPERAAAAARPVLVHLHAGDFATGWGSHTGPPRLLSRGIVVVTLNYRLGAEGFLCLGTGAAPGNAGLHDQAAALRWVHANIAAFGGDPEQVTLYGTGAGAAAAEFLLLSGAIDGFIQQLILEAGSALAPTSLTDDPVTTALEVARSLGYEDDDTKTADDLTAFYQNIAIEKTLNFSNKFTPCVEDVTEYYSALIIKDPKEILQSGILKPVPLLIAYSKERSVLSNTSMFYNLPYNFEDLLPNNLKFESDDIKSKIGEQVKESYFGANSGGALIEGYESYINDVFTVYPMVKSATLHAAASSLPVYLMEFLPRDESETTFEYIFGKETFSEEEELVAEKFVTLWSNFIMYSDPTPLETSLLPLVWPPVTFRLKNEKPDISTATCLIFDPAQMLMSMGVPSSGHTLPIWDHIYDNFYKSRTITVDMSEDDMNMYDEQFSLMSSLSQEVSQREELSVDTSSTEGNNEEEENGQQHNGGGGDSESVDQVDNDNKVISTTDNYSEYYETNSDEEENIKDDNKETE